MDYDKIIHEAQQQVNAEQEERVRGAIRRSLVYLRDAQLAFERQRESHVALMATIRSGKFDFLAVQNH